MIATVAAILVVVFAILLAWVPLARDGKIAVTILLVLALVVLLYGGIAVRIG